MKHTDVCTLLKNWEDKPILTRRLFDVNMRLFQSSSGYKALVIQAANYIREMATTEKEGYKKPHGWSGANAGIPWNIVALADGTVMLNPKLTEFSSEMKKVKSNCGSLMLDEPIEIERHAHVVCKYWDLEGRLQEMHGFLPTVQHEIDHNQGILITDRYFL